VEAIIVAYLLATNVGDWLPMFLFGVILAGLLLWALWLTCWRWLRR
jgi:hypothetical protein